MMYALSGRIVTMDPDRTVIDHGVVYVRDRRIHAVLDSRQPPPAGFERVRVIPTQGTIYPGLIDLHNHISYNLLPLWRVDRRYTNRDQWAGTAHYQAHVTGPMRVLGESPDLLAPLARYVECKSLLAGVTSTQGIAMFSNAGVRRYYRGLVRNVEQALDPELPNAAGRIADIEARDAEAFKARLERTRCVLLHLSEGTDTKARSHFLALRAASGWAMAPSLAGIHCVGLRKEDFERMAKHGASMVWSPTSNLLLYGRTADVFAARKAGLRVGLGADWSTSGTRNLLGELRVARAYAGERIPAADLVAMATCNAASILGWDRQVGSIEAGKRADLMVLAGASSDPYDALTRADESSVRLVTIDGAPRAATPALMKALGADGEVVRFGDCTRVVSFRDASADPAVPFVELRHARDSIRGAMRRLPQLAADLERKPRENQPRGRKRAGRLEWRMALDDFPNDPLPRAALSEFVQPIELDPLTIAGDPDYWQSIVSQPNLPCEVSKALESWS